MNKMLDCVELNPVDPVQASVIWMHGLGADGHDFEALVPALELPDSLAVRFVFPHAPKRSVTINGGLVMRAWYDIVTPDLMFALDEAGIRASCQAVGQLIEREAASGLPPERVLLAGFSQGGVITLETALRYPRTLAGIMVLSGYLPLASKLTAEAHRANRATPIFYAHGTQDPVIPVAYAHAARASLEQLGYAVEWHEYAMPHTVALEEISAIRGWLLRVLG